MLTVIFFKQSQGKQRQQNTLFWLAVTQIPPRRIPGQYRAEVEKQIQEMLDQGIITESSSPWMAPAVFVPKKSGEINLNLHWLSWS